MLSDGPELYNQEEAVLIRNRVSAASLLPENARPLSFVLGTSL